MVAGLILSVIVVPIVAPAALLGASVGGFTCDQGPSSCDTTPVAALADDAPDADEPRYATQAIIDCPTPIAAGALEAMPGGECDGTPRDTWYRASRDPESERLPGSLRPARRERSAAGVRAACAGNPIEGHDGAGNPSPNQPLALFAVPALELFTSSRFSLDSPAAVPSRAIRPLERPPRA